MTFLPTGETGDPAQHTQLASPPRITSADVHKVEARNVWLNTPALSDHSFESSFSVPASAGALRFTHLIEIQRQAGIVHAHRMLGVPRSDVFMLNYIELSLSPGAELGHHYRSGAISVSSPTPRPPSGRYRAATQGFVLTSHERELAAGTSHATFVDRAVFTRLRNSQFEARPPEARDDPRAISMLLEPDPADVVLTDHQSDHVPAMAMVAGLERAMEAAAPSAYIGSATLRFHSYAERERGPLHLRLVRNEYPVFSGTIEQGARVIASASLRLRERN